MSHSTEPLIVIISQGGMSDAKFNFIPPFLESETVGESLPIIH